MCAPGRVILSNRFYLGNEPFPTRANTWVCPYDAKEKTQVFSVLPVTSDKPRFPLSPKPSPEEKVAHCLCWRQSLYKRLGIDVILFLSYFGGSVTEEGKRSVSYLGRSVRGQVRLPSSVTAPQNVQILQHFILFQNTAITITILLRCRATFPSGEGFCSLRRFCETLPYAMLNTSNRSAATRNPN